MYPWPWFVKQGPALTIDELNVFENTIAVLPFDYYNFLSETNGGVPDDEHLAFREGVITKFLSMSEIVAWNERVQPELDAREVIVIAYDESGGTILLVCEGGRRGQVWFRPPTPPAKLNLGRPWHADALELAGSFADFMASLQPLRR